MYVVSTMARLLTLLVLAVLATPALTRAGATTPTLVLATGSVLTQPGAAPTATFGATFDHSNAIQADYDLELLVWQGRRFARYPISGGARIGESAALDDGFDAADLPALDAASAPAPGDVRLVTLAPVSMSVALPGVFASGSASAALVATVDEGTVLSNPLTFALP